MRRLKTSVCAVVMFFLSRAIKATYKLDDSVKREIDSLGEGFAVKMQACDGGPAMEFWLEDGRVKTLTGKKAKEKQANLTFVFKNVEGAFLVLTGQVGVANAYCQHRMLVYGDIYKAMSIVRIIDVVENYLFPSFITGKILKRKPIKKVSSLRVYAGVIFGA